MLGKAVGWPGTQIGDDQCVDQSGCGQESDGHVNTLPSNSSASEVYNDVSK